MPRLSLPVALIVSAAFVLSLAAPTPVWALDDAHQKKAQETLKKAVEFLRSTQGKGRDGKTVDKAGKPIPPGAWTPMFGPAITAYAVTVMLDQPDIKADDPAVKKGLDYILSKVQPDGSISDGILPNYNTSISLSALSRVNNQPGTAAIIKKAQAFLRGLQWAGQKDPAGKAIDEAHPFYGGAGYGDEGRPDMSNTQTMIQGLYDSGLDCKDPAYQRALVFLTRLQGTAANKEYGSKIEPNGGAIYSLSTDKDHIGTLETKVGTSENDKGEDVNDGSGQYTDEQGNVRLRTYGSATFAVFKCYLYAQVDRQDPRVKDCFRWLQNNYTVDHNAGMTGKGNMQGYYNYMMTMSRALKAWGTPTITTADGKTHDWANELIDRLAELQRPDGSFVNPSDRWAEGDANLTTCYAAIALQTAIK